MNDTARQHGFRSINPASGVARAAYSAMSAAALDAALAEAASAQRAWAGSAVDQRASVLRAIGAGFRAQREELARLATAEMGKTYASALAEVDKCAANCDWYAQHGGDFLRSTDIAMPSGRARVDYLPLGIVLAIMPWNFPFWQAMRFIAPALMAGNGVLLKHAANVPGCALAIERVVRAAGAELGMPEAVFTNLFVETDAIAGIIADDRVAAVTLTGSERAGMAVAQAAGRALKKCVLELGGSDPFIVMPSADVAAAAKTGLHGRMQNNGQSCVCSKRFLIHASLYDGFTDDFVARAHALHMGDPMDATTELGPLCTHEARRNLHDQVMRAVAAGARILTGGAIPDGPGIFYPPTVLDRIPTDALIAREEFFGPVAMLFQIENAAHACTLANDVPFGLGSSVWTTDEDEAEYFIRNIQSGITAINTLVYSDPRVPFGGIKRSGYGRELAEHGMREFLNVKTVLRA